MYRCRIYVHKKISVITILFCFEQLKKNYYQNTSVISKQNNFHLYYDPIFIHNKVMQCTCCYN